MKLPLNKIELMTATKDVRFYLNSVQLDVENKRLIATDGHAVAVLPVELDDGDTAGSISQEAIKAARRDKAYTILAKGALVMENGANLARPDAYTYPDIDKVIPAAHDGLVIGLNAELLYRLAQALGAGSKNSYIKLYIPKDNASCIRVEPSTGEGYGAIMPCRV